MSASRKEHWEHVHQNHGPTTHSWYQPVPAKSMAHIRATGVPAEAPIIDVGAGTATLVDVLLNSDYSDISVLDIAAAALTESSKRLGDVGTSVHWIESDVLEFEPLRRYYVWHDRAAFHFLTDATSVGKYLDVLRRALVPKGYFVLGTFGPEGPDRCSGFDVQRYSIEQLTNLLEADFELTSFELEDHTTPTGNMQQFLYSVWRSKV
jgi:SAM-dependent methyltransferase